LEAAWRWRRLADPEAREGSNDWRSRAAGECTHGALGKLQQQFGSARDDRVKEFRPAAAIPPAALWELLIGLIA
jgi:hypothetical protein